MNTSPLLAGREVPDNQIYFAAAVLATPVAPYHDQAMALQIAMGDVFATHS